MRGIVTIGTKEVGMLANAASPAIYRRVFHEDFLHDMQERTQNGNEVAIADLFCQMGFVMAMQDSKPVEELFKLSQVDYLNWLSQFGANDVAMASVDIATLYQKQEETTSKPKKEDG